MQGTGNRWRLMMERLLAGFGACAVLDHVGIAVVSLEAASGFYEGLGLVGGDIERLENEGVRVRMYGADGGRIELLEALGAETALGRFLARRGEGLHHVAFRVAGLDRVCDEIARRGVRLVGDGVRVGAGGHRYRFVHPDSAGGVLVELVEVGA